MALSCSSESAFVDSKIHFHLLDGLRGVAALMVLVFHIFEAFATSHLDQIVNHGYLAVDFFFMLSGFVMAYAYDARLKSMGLGTFFKRRLIRLQPMVIMGSLLGAALFYLQDCQVWDVSAVSAASLGLALLLGALLIPAAPGVEVRGLGEMFPLNGPAWSLFFEYVGNILYALVLVRLSNKWLGLLVALAGAGLAAFALFGPLGDICAGFSLSGMEPLVGSLRLLFGFGMGLLLFRMFKPLQCRSAFWRCSAVLVVLLALPRLGGSQYLWLNGLYDLLCVALVFPLVIRIAASAAGVGERTRKLCQALGALSYPLYMVHYPLIYWYYAWVKKHELSFVQSLPGALGVVFGSVLLAWLCLKCYDAPLRRFLAARLKTRANAGEQS